MEVPEKLYILFNHPYTVDYTKLNKRRCKEEVEYIRKDVFVEKVLKYLDANFYFNDSRYSIECRVFDSKEKMLEDIKKYMEG